MVPNRLLQEIEGLNEQQIADLLHYIRFLKFKSQQAETVSEDELKSASDRLLLFCPPVHQKNRNAGEIPAFALFRDIR